MDNQRRSVYVGPKDVGHLFVDCYGVVWKMISYVGDPQARFAPVEKGAKYEDSVEHVIGCQNYHEMGLQRLVVEQEAYPDRTDNDGARTCGKCGQPRPDRWPGVV